VITAAQKKYGCEEDDDNIADALHLLNMIKERLSV